MDQRLIEAGIELGDTTAIKLKLRELGYRARLLLKGPHDEITMECEKGGKGIACTHTWKTTPMEAIRGEGCPHCALEDYVANGEPPEVTEAEMAKAIKAQHKWHTDNIARAQRKYGRRAGNNYGLDKYGIGAPV